MAVEDRIRLFDRSGTCLCDLRVTAERNLSINEEGEAEFDIAYTDVNSRDDFLRFGNWLLIENSKLGPWVGMVDRPQVGKKRFTHIHAYTPEHQLAKRNVPRQLPLNGKAGVIFKEIINLMNREEPTIISIGDVWSGGRDMGEESLNGDNLKDVLQNLTERSGGEYSFTPTVFKGKLSILANWHKEIGEVNMYPLEESWNISDENNSYRLDGDIENEIWGYGSGAGQTDRPTATFADNESIGIYGLMQGSRVYSDYSDEGSVLTAVRNEVNDTRFPKKIYSVSMLDVGETFSQVKLGNTHPFRLWSVGFGVKTTIRVVEMYYNPYRGKVDLHNQEVFDDVSG